MADVDYAGRALGLPESGVGSMGRLGRRLIALLIDWAVANLVAYVIVRDPQVYQPPVTLVDALPLAVFAVMLVLMTAYAGGTVGQRILGIAVVRLDGTPVGLPRAALRTLLILLVVPPLVHGADDRGLHDKAAGTVILRSRA